LYTDQQEVCQVAKKKELTVQLIDLQCTFIFFGKDFEKEAGAKSGQNGYTWAKK
jgi:hypothetical protein